MDSFNETDIVFSNLAVVLKPPHMPHLKNTKVTLTIDFGLGRIPTTTYQVIGTNDMTQPIYLTGGGGISINTINESIIGAIELKGILYTSGTQLTDFTTYYGSVVLNISNNVCNLNGTMSAVGLGMFAQRNLHGTLCGKGVVMVQCGIRKISFPNLSINLYLPAPKIKLR
jgi:hypothetical protein